MLELAFVTIILAPIVAFIGYAIISHNDGDALMRGSFLAGVGVITFCILAVALFGHLDQESQKKDTACVVTAMEHADEYLTADDIERACK